MNSRKVPYKRTVLACVHARAEGRVACGNPGRGGAELAQALKDGAKRMGLKGTVRVVKSGCLDLCELGPNVFVYPDGEWLAGASAADAEEILKKAAA